MIAADLGLVGTIYAQADRDKLKDDHPLRGVAGRMNASLVAYYKDPTPLMHAQLLVVWAATKLEWQRYLENRFDPEPTPRKYKKSRPESWGSDVGLYIDSLIAGSTGT